MAELINRFIEKFLSLPPNSSRDLGKPKNFLIIRQHNQLGDMLAGVSLFRAIKEKYPDCKITVIASPANYQAVKKNRYIDTLVNFNKKRLFSIFYFLRLIGVLRKGYDVVIVPVVVSISFTSNLLARLSKSTIRIGPESLEGKTNKSAYFFDRLVKLDWRHQPDSNVADRILDIVRPFGINTNNYRSEISFEKKDLLTAEKFIKTLDYTKKEILIGIHVGAGKPPNRWSLNKYIELIEKLKKEYAVCFYLTGSSADKEELDYMKKNLPFEIKVFLNHSIAEVAALVSKTHLFITNDTGIMHVAGATNTPQISIFGPTNPFNWAPVGANKIFLRKSEFIDDITVDDVYSACKMALSGKKQSKKQN